MNDEFLSQMIPTKDIRGRVICSVGTKYTSKSFMALKYLEAMLQTDLFDKYVLVLPNLKIEQNDSYAFLKKYKHKKIMTLEKYSSDLTRKVINTQKEKKNKGKMLFYFIDDASSQGMGSLDKKDDYLKDLLTSIRHYSCFLWLIGHGKSVFNTFLRANSDIFLFYNMTNKMLLKGLYEEFLSMFPEYPKFEIFMNEFVEHHNKNKFSCLYLNTRNRFKSYEFKQLVADL